ncbi:MAG: hydroxyacylglutathione hydrolase [Rhodanobacteraceae bacterium]|nr:MAG: hydroxyacylglutathione hydrolase [Rhodanobacteraceae bacterium]
MPTLRPLPALRDNYIWMLADATAGCALVVDPGAAKPVLDALTGAGLRLSTILLTHHHADHIGGVPELARRYPDAAIYAPRDSRIPVATHRVADGDAIHVAPAADFTVIEVHGHTRTHVAYYGEGLLFCGDTLFSLGCGRVFEGTPAEMLASLDRLAELPTTTQICCAHEYTLANGAFALSVEPGNHALQARIRSARDLRARNAPTLPALLADELAANPFLRVDAMGDANIPWPTRFRPPPGRAARFAALRLAKDRFAA